MGRFSKLEPEKLKSMEKDFYSEEEESYDAHQCFIKGDEEYFVGNFEKSIKYYSKSLQLENSRIDAWIGQINALIAIRQYKEADLWAGQGLMLFPENADLIALRGVTYALKGFLKRAIGSSDFSLNKGNSPTVWISRGEILLIAQNKNSFFCFEKAMELGGSNDWKIPMQIGMIFHRHRMYSSALKYLTKAGSFNSTNFYLWYLIARCNYHLDFKEKANAAVKRAIEINPNFSLSKNTLKEINRFSLFRQIKNIFKRRK